MVALEIVGDICVGITTALNCSVVVTSEVREPRDEGEVPGVKVEPE